jgi:hypothetical protein
LRQNDYKQQTVLRKLNEEWMDKRTQQKYKPEQKLCYPTYQQKYRIHRTANRPKTDEIRGVSEHSIMRSFVTCTPHKPKKV